MLDRVARGSRSTTRRRSGPIAPLITVGDVDEAIDVAQLVPVRPLLLRLHRQSRRAFRVAERLECGVVNVNETAAYWDGRTPFGGYSGKASGVGRLGGAATIESMTQLKSIVLDVGA